MAFKIIDNRCAFFITVYLVNLKTTEKHIFFIYAIESDNKLLS